MANYVLLAGTASPPLAGAVWLLNFKEREEGILSSSQGMYALSRLFLRVKVLSCHMCGMQRPYHLSNGMHLHLFSKHQN